MSALSKCLCVPLLLLALSLFVSISEASGKASSCSSRDARAAEEVADAANSWGQLHRFYERFRHCDDGSIAEGFSESASMLLDKKWQDVRDFERLSRKDPRFKRFVIRHLDETVPVRLDRIEHNASNSCPKKLKNLCREMVDAITHLRQTK